MLLDQNTSIRTENLSNVQLRSGVSVREELFVLLSVLVA